MRYNLIRYSENFYANYWVIPSLMTIGAIILAYLIHLIGGYFDKDFLLEINYENSMDILSVLASATATMSSVILSITVLILSLASNQLGPRLIPNFMKQGRTQIIIGYFLGSFAYPLFGMLLITINSYSASELFLITSIGVIIGIICFFLIIYFIHYVCHVIQIDNILVFLGNEISHCLKRNLKPLSDHAHQNTDSEEQLCGYLTTPACSISSGYIQIIDFDKCLKLAIKYDCIIEILFRPGHYLWENQICFNIRHQHPLDPNLAKQLPGCLTLGIRRNTIQDIEFAFEQLAEIAIRALSPSMANPFTAINCADRLGYAIQCLNQYAEDEKFVYDEEKQLRLVKRPRNFENIIESGFVRLRQQAKTDLKVSIRLLQIFYSLLMQNLQVSIERILLKQSEALIEALEQNNISTADGAKVNEHYQRIKNYFEL